VMEPIRSNAHPDIVPATQFSSDGVTWKPIPSGISVLGSRYALVLDEIKPGDLEINLAEYEVAIGPSSGKRADAYLQGRVDKGCFARSDQSLAFADARKAMHKAGFIGRLKEPFGVLLR